MLRVAHVGLELLHRFEERALTDLEYLGTTTNRGNPRSAEDRRITKHLKEVFGADSPLSTLTAAKITAYRDGRLGAKSARTNRKVQAATVNRPRAVLRHILRAHEEWELLPSVPKIKLAKEPQGRERWLTVEEEARLLAACVKSQNKNLLALVTVALESGLRKGELLGLTWDRVDMTRGVLQLGVTKSGRRREVPMRQAVYDTLAALPGGARKSRDWPARSIRTAFENAVAEAKLDRPFHFHDTRHHFASWYVMRGGSLPALQQILGHATLAMTMRYSHLSPKHLRDEMERTERAGFVSDRAQGRAQETLTQVEVSANIA